MVARAAGDRYGGTIEAGRQFLEKIVQYPFTLPAVGRQRLLGFIEKRAFEACTNANITLSTEEWRQFADVAESCLSKRLRTPRQAIRYANALTFALPMLKGEVNPLDQMMVEGLRVLYPELYGFVRDNSDVFIFEEIPMGGLRIGPPAGFRARDQNRPNLTDFASKSITDADERDAGIKLVNILFGHVERNQGVSLPSYFDRYFSYSVAPDDISDQELRHFLDMCEGGVGASLDELLRKLVKRNEPVFIGRLRGRTEQLSSEVRERMAITLARNGGVFASSGAAAVGTSQRAATLIGELIVSRHGEADQRAIMAKTVLSTAQPVPFAVMIYEELFSEARNLQAEWRERRPKEELWPDGAQTQLRTNVVDRIRETTKVRPPYEQWEPRTALALLNLWNSANADEARQYLTKRIRHHPEEAVEILKLYPGMSMLGFYSLRRLVDMEILANALKIVVQQSSGVWSETSSLISSFFSLKRVIDADRAPTGDTAGGS
jgi:hypothetical protein